jgi:glycosyltransferase involved in cell wall biosynthesis
MMERLSTKGCSVIICCHNSSKRIASTLSHIADQVVEPGFPWELVLVDNASTDDTINVSQKTWKELGAPVPLVVVNEHHLGLSFARRAGVMASQYEVLVFCDDDNWLDSDYILNATRMLGREPSIGVMGARISPIWEGGSSIPDWFYAYSDSYAVGVQGLGSSDVTRRGFLWGAGMVLRGDLLKLIYDRNIHPLLSDREGLILASGGDSEICAWYRLAGYRLWYEDSLHLSHLIPVYRQNIDYVERLHEGFDKARPILSAYNDWIQKLEIRKLYYRKPLESIKTTLKCWRWPVPLNRAMRRNVNIICNAKILIGKDPKPINQVNANGLYSRFAKLLRRFSLIQD